MTKIKICGISRDVDAQYLNEIKPDYAGFIIDFPKSRRNISHERARALRGLLAEEITTVGVFVNAPEEIAAELATSGVIGVIQLHGSEDDEYIERLRVLTGGNTEIWKSFIVKSEDDIAKANSSGADKVLLDGGMGGGKGFDYSLIRGIKRGFIIAGGISSNNIEDVMTALSPMCVDVSSGVEENGVKSKEKIADVVTRVRNFSL